MHVISLRRLREFWEKHPDAQSPLRAWFKQVDHAKWENFSELQSVFPSADQVKRMTVFNIGGNKYRLISCVEYERQRVYIRTVLTHAEYDKEKWKNDPWYQ